MDFGYDLSGISTPILKKYPVAATNTVLGVPYLKAAANGSGIVLSALGGGVDFIGVNIDAAGTYVTAQQSDNSDTERLTTLVVNPQAVFRARLSGGAASGTALTAQAITTASADGLSVITSGFDPASPTMDEGMVWGATGANAGIGRKITQVASNDATVVVSFPNDIAVGDTFFYVGISPLSTITVQLTTELTEIDATAAISGDAPAICVEMILNDSANNGDRESYAFIQFADHLLGATVT